MTEKEIIIMNRAGLHARPAALLVETANKYESKIYLEKDSQSINAKSIMGIITLGATYNTKLKIVTEGPDEEDALNALASLFEKKFEED